MRDSGIVDMEDATDTSDAIETAIDPSVMDSVKEQQENVGGSQEDTVYPIDNIILTAQMWSKNTNRGNM